MEVILPSRIDAFTLPNSDSKFELWIKRDDDIHPNISGNKYRKLMPNIRTAINNKNKGIITFGGAMSNHIYSTAAACKMFGLHCVGIIRGDESSKYNHTLTFASDNGMKLHFVSREDYRNKEDSITIKAIISQYTDYYLIPEGGDNEEGMLGCKEIVKEILNQMKMPDIITVAAGTGNTAEGMLRAIIENNLKTKLWIFSILKSDFHRQRFLKIDPHKSHFEYFTDFHGGGYAKVNKELANFMNNFHKISIIKIDPIYNGKVLFAINTLLSKDNIEFGSLLHLHTGGLQGLSAYQENGNVPILY